ncbi:hypothetical protein D3C84_845000 [compost metagenome]
MPIGVHRRQARRRVVVVQGDNRQLAALLVLVLGGHLAVRVAIAQAKLPATDVLAGDGDRAKLLAACALPALTRHHQQLAVRDLGRAVVLLGQARDEIKIGFADLIGALDLDGQRAHRLPAVTRGDIGDDLRQRHVFPAAATNGLATAAHVAGLTLNHDGVGRT